MKTLFPVMVISALLVTFGFAQIPDAGSNTGSANIKGCLGGSDGSYTVAEDGTRQIFKITTSSVDLKPHLGHDVALVGHKAGGAVSSGADNSFAVTELSMISEHCAGAAAVPAATVIPPSETVVAPAAAATVTASTPAADVAATAATVNPSAATVSIPVVDAAAPVTATAPAADTAATAATVNPSAAAVSIPVVDATAPVTATAPAADTAAAATVNPSAAAVSVPATSAVDAAAAPAAAAASPSSATVIKPAADAVHPTRLSAHPRKPSTTQAAAATTLATTVSPSSDTVVPTAADAVKPSATVNPSDAVSTPVPATTAPKATHRGSLWLLVAFVVLVVLLGTLAPLLSRWRKRRMLERTGTPNLAFTKCTKKPKG